MLHDLRIPMGENADISDLKAFRILLKGRQSREILNANLCNEFGSTSPTTLVSYAVCLKKASERVSREFR